MTSLHRRSVAVGVLGISMLASIPSPSRLQAQSRRDFLFLDPRRLDDPLPAPTVEALKGNCVGSVSYVLRNPQSNRNGRPILYFHGYGGDYRSALPPEYPLSDHYDLFCVHRPGYGATQDKKPPTSLEWQVEGNSFGPSDPLPRTGARETAKIAAALMDKVLSSSTWQVVVIGTSGGSPAALAFASLFPDRTKGLILQAGFSHPWWYKQYVSEIFRRSYEKAVAHPDTTATCSSTDRTKRRYCQVTAKLQLLLLSTMNNELNTHEKWIRALVGTRRSAVTADPAGEALMKLEAPDPPNNDPLIIPGAINDYFTLFRSDQNFCDWTKIQAPTLIIHDPKDPFVPFFHAQQAAARIKHNTLQPVVVGGHMVWLGAQAGQMHAARLRFLRSVGWST